LGGGTLCLPTGLSPWPGDRAVFATIGCTVSQPPRGGRSPAPSVGASVDGVRPAALPADAGPPQLPAAC